MKKLLLILFVAISLNSMSQDMYMIKHIMIDTADWRPSKGMIILDGNVAKIHCEKYNGTIKAYPESHEESKTPDGVQVDTWDAFWVIDDRIVDVTFRMIHHPTNKSFIIISAGGLVAFNALK